MPFPAPSHVKDASEFSAKDLEKLEEFIIDNVKSINSKLSSFRSSKLPEYVRLYKGTPKSEEANFPWPGAANLIIQLIGTFCDELLSRVMAIYMYDPLWTVHTSGDTSEQTGEELRKILEKFLMDEAYDPASLDMYRVEQAFFNSAIKYGTGIVEFPWEYDVEQEYKHLSGGEDEDSKVEFKFNDVVKRDGPHPRLVPLNKFGIDPSIPTLADASFFYTVETLSYWDVENLKDRSALYSSVDEDILDELLHSPDRDGVDEMQEEIDRELSLGQGEEHKGMKQYDFYNCYIKYSKGRRKYSILAKYNHKIKKVLFSIFNFYPKNLFPVEDVKLAYDDESYFGTGYAQMLKTYQKELSQNSNWRTNNRNFAMMGIFRVDPGSKLSSVLQMYPGVMVPAKDGEIERIQAGADVGNNDASDQFIMACAKERAGVDPAIGGTGGGLVNNKRGIYSASGTSMVLIQQNNRNNLRMSDMRTAHTRIAIKLMDMYAAFGIGDKLRKYGSQSETLKAAFMAYLNATLGFRLRPTTASANKELDRQNDILLAGALERHYAASAQMIQALSQPGMPPALAKYYTDVLTAGTSIYRTICGNFNHPDMNKLVPKYEGAAPQQGPQQGAGVPNGQPGGANPQPSANPGLIPTGGVQGSSAPDTIIMKLLKNYYRVSMMIVSGAL
jgi:hypothetical protein